MKKIKIMLLATIFISLLGIGCLFLSTTTMIGGDEDKNENVEGVANKENEVTSADPVVVNQEEDASLIMLGQLKETTNNFNDQINKKLEEVTVKLTASEEEIKKYHESARDIANKLKEVTNKYAASNEATKKFQEDFNQKTERLKNLEEAHTTALKKFGENLSHEEVIGKSKEAKEKLKELQQLKSQEEAENRKIDEEMKILQGQIATLQGQIESETKKHEEGDLTLGQLKIDLETKNKQKDELTVRLEEAEKKITETTTQEEILQKQLKDLEENEKKLAEEEGKINDEVKNLEAQFNDLEGKNKNNDEKNGVNELTGHIEELTKAIDHENNFKAALEKVKNNWERSKKMFEEKAVAINAAHQKALEIAKELPKAIAADAAANTQQKADNNDDEK